MGLIVVQLFLPQLHGILLNSLIVTHLLSSFHKEAV